MGLPFYLTPLSYHFILPFYHTFFGEALVSPSVKHQRLNDKTTSRVALDTPDRGEEND